MKKNILFGGMLLLAAAFTGCSEDFKDWASPISNPQPDAITIAGVSASAASNSVDLANAEENVKLISLSTSTFPEGTVLDKMRIVLVPSDIDGVDAKTLSAISTMEGTFSKQALQEIIEGYYGKRPDVRSFDAQVYLDGIYNGQAAYIDAGSVKLNLIPEAPYIAPNYYIVGGTKDWNDSKEQKFSHSDADVYDDPIFTIVIDGNPNGDCWFAIGDDEGVEAIGENVWNKLLGIVGGDSQATSGQLDYRYNMGADNSFCVSDAKKIKITIDMMEQTFEVTKVNIADNYYLIGGPGDWDAKAAMNMPFTHSDKDVFDDPVFTYVFAGTGSEMWFAFGDKDAIDAVAAGDWKQLFGTTGASEDPSGDLKRRYDLDGDHSFHVDGQAKFYRFQINMAEMTYTITALNFDPFIYFIGATDGWANAEQKLALTDESGIYTGYIYCADPNGWGNCFKFQKVPGDWGTEINTGHMTGGMTGGVGLHDGDTNFEIKDGEGVYYMTVNMATMSIDAVKITNMNLVGDFNSWSPNDDAQQMTWDAENYCYVITGAGVNANGWKFTANNAWDINLGANDTVEPSSVIDDLVGFGKNLNAVGTTIKLYPTRKTSDKIYCTVE